ncbi:hypothetical protein bpr_II193 (plasmid) [Butyrivibrio proteoclasticus B316]|uniref:Uncharacterized protein n=1 Tax=Butyrivibrio proteoclasticus (strain ATCC 51982 / DSM 14932 / B316) TaxID=515622 RepID=E0S3Z9_BUTPB|nr:hypothetical protein [Butyrivibrio proteoclasticus]ADL36131.1 hypothetical protein bpr_II193 [Butyrivibrio proteoclasticus B316]
MNKTKFLSLLTENGFKAGFANSGIPTAFVQSPDDIAATKAAVERLARESDYHESFGIQLLKTEE